MSSFCAEPARLRIRCCFCNRKTADQCVLRSPFGLCQEMHAMSEFTTQQKLACAQCEVRRRKKAFPSLILMGIMTREKADYETRVMLAIEADYQRLVDEESGVLPLFPMLEDGD